MEIKNIIDILHLYGIENYSIVDGKVNVDGNVRLSEKGLTKLPVNFGVVTGYFDCYNNQLTTLEGAPNSVGGNFNCSNNQLTTLEGAPDIVGGNFYCYKNQLTTLDGSPSKVLQLD